MFDPSTYFMSMFYSVIFFLTCYSSFFFSFFFFFNDTATTEIYTLSYTTLFRSIAVALRVDRRRSGERMPAEPARHRSEEHTSELQSLRHLVCRLLLEKKKKKK